MSEVKPILVSKKVAAKLLGISLATLDRLIRQKQIQAVRIGSRVLVRRRDIENFDGERFYWPLPREVKRQSAEMPEDEDLDPEVSKAVN